MSVFDWSKAVIQKELFEGGDVGKPTEFIKDQIKFHSLNKLSGRFFNPIGFVASVSDSDNPFLSQLLSSGVSDIVQAGAFDTTDGKTFVRTADNNSQDLFFDSAEEFKSAIGGGDKSFLESVSRKAVNGLINRVGQAIGIEVSGTRSIMGQVIAYNSSLIEGKLHGTESQLGSYYGNTPFRSKDNVELNPIGDQALTYTHDVLSFTGRLQEMIKLRRKIADGYFAQNVAVKKPREFVEESSRKNIEKQSKIERALLRVKGVQNLLTLFNRSLEEPNEYWVNRMVDYKPFMDEEFIGSAQRKLDPDFISVFRTLVANRLNKNVDDYNSIPNYDYLDMFRDVILSEIEDHYDFESSAFLDIEKKRIEKLRDNATYRFTSESTKTTPIYTNISKKFQIGSEEFGDGSFTTLKNLLGDTKVLDDVSESDIINANSQIAEEQQLRNSESGDHVFFAIQDVRNNNIMFLQPTIESITEDIQPTYSDVFYLGRTESLPSYERTTRSINFSFTLSARTPKELLLMYKKMEFIQKLTYPKMENQFRKSITPLCKISIGDFYKNVGGYLTTFTKSIDNSTTMWENQRGYRIPKVIQCSLSFIVIHDTMPYINEENEFPDDVFIHGNRQR